MRPCRKKTSDATTLKPISSSDQPDIFLFYYFGFYPTGERRRADWGWRIPTWKRPASIAKPHHRPEGTWSINHMAQKVLWDCGRGILPLPPPKAAVMAPCQWREGCFSYSPPLFPGEAVCTLELLPMGGHGQQPVGSRSEHIAKQEGFYPRAAQSSQWTDSKCVAGEGRWCDF